jgi:hypothetical protein
MLRLLFAAAAALFLLSPADARVVERQEYGNWVYEYNVSRNITSCVASRYYSNAQFSVRLYDERMDVVFFRDDFRWAWDSRLGTARIDVGGRSYRLNAGTARRADATRPTSQALYLDVRSGDYRAFFQAVQRARNLTITVPNGKAYPVDLTGSSRALSAALRCWERRNTGR